MNAKLESIINIKCYSLFTSEPRLFLAALEVTSSASEKGMMVTTLGSFDFSTLRISQIYSYIVIKLYICLTIITLIGSFETSENDASKCPLNGLNRMPLTRLFLGSACARIFISAELPVRASWTRIQPELVPTASN